MPGDFVAYWRTQKYERGAWARLVGGRWFGTAIVMGKVGRNVQVYHRRNMFKVSPEHLRHATLEERAVAQSDGREMLGIAQYVGENGSLRGSHYVDLTQQGSPEGPDSPTAARPTAEHAPSQASSVPSPASAPAQLVSPDNMDVVAPGEIVDKSPAETSP